MSYEKKINDCMGRVYRYNYSQKPKRTVRLKEEIKRNVEKPKFDMNEDVDNIILIAIEGLHLLPYMADRTKQIMYELWSPENFHDIKYENAILGIIMYLVYENLSGGVTVDFNKYCEYLFGVANAKKNRIQMYKAYNIVNDLRKKENEGITIKT